MVCVGIDFGTTNSSVGVWVNDHVEIISNPQGNRVTPSVVSFDSPSHRLVGDPALAQLAKNPTGTFHSVKRLLGKKFSDPIVQEAIKKLPYQVVEYKEYTAVQVTFEEQTLTLPVEAIVSYILEDLKASAEQFLGQEVTSVIMSAPANYGDPERQALRDAATMAKLNITRIINEPTAAALAYGFTSPSPSPSSSSSPPPPPASSSTEMNVLVFDLGGGTFDVSILRVADGVHEVKTTLGERYLGGDDFDHRLVTHFAAEFQRKHKLDLMESKRSVQKLRVACERAKKSLSSNQQASIEVDSLHEGIDFFSSITRARFEDLCADLFKKTIDLMAAALKDSGFTVDQITEVVMAGGSSRIPKIQQLVSTFFQGKEVRKSVQPEEAIATGATMQGAIQSGNFQPKEALVLDVLSLSIGVESFQGVMTTLLKRKAVLPTRASLLFSTLRNDQENVFIKVFEGERLKTKGNKLIGQFMLQIEPRPRGVPQIEVMMEVDTSGTLHVTASDKSSSSSSSGGNESISVTRIKERVTAQEVEDLIIAAESYKIEDTNLKEKIDVRAELLETVSTNSNLLNNPNAVERLPPEAVAQAKTILESVMTWAEENFEATKEAHAQKTQELKASLETLLSVQSAD